MTSRTCFRCRETHHQARCSGARLACLAFVLLLSARSASPQTQDRGQPATLASFRLDAEDSQRTATVECVDRQGVVYASLRSLVEQLGGGCNVLRTRVKIDFARGTALIGINDIQVDASLRSFTLRHPVLLHEKDALIAVADVGPFFATAFRAKVAQVTTRAALGRPAAIQPPAERVSVRALPGPDGTVARETRAATPGRSPGPARPT